MYRKGNVPRRREDTELFPQGLTQAGFRRTNGEGPSRPANIPVINFNIDVKARLHLTKEAEAFLGKQQAPAGALA